MREWRYSSTILDLGIRWRRLVNIAPRQFTPPHPLDRRLGGPQSRSGCRGEKSLAPAENRTPAVQPVAVLTQLSQYACYVP
jgi:hypothetical protein